MTNKFHELDEFYELDGIVQRYYEWIEEAKEDNGFIDEEAKSYVDEGIESGVLVEVVWNSRSQQWEKA